MLQAVGEASERAAEESSGRLAALYAQHVPEAVRLAYVMTGDRALAEDLAQEAFARMVGRLAHLRHADAFGAYLRKTVMNVTRNHFRRRGVERAYLERHGRAPVGDVLEGDAIAARHAMRDALLALPERQRAAIVLRYYEDLSEREIADVLRCRPGTVKSLVSRGMESLRAGMRGEGDD